MPRRQPSLRRLQALRAAEVGRDRRRTAQSPEDGRAVRSLGDTRCGRRRLHRRGSSAPGTRVRVLRRVDTECCRAAKRHRIARHPIRRIAIDGGGLRLRCACHAGRRMHLRARRAGPLAEAVVNDLLIAERQGVSRLLRGARATPQPARCGAREPGEQGAGEAEARATRVRLGLCFCACRRLFERAQGISCLVPVPAGMEDDRELREGHGRPLACAVRDLTVLLAHKALTAKGLQSGGPLGGKGPRVPLSRRSDGSPTPIPATLLDYLSASASRRPAHTAAEEATEGSITYAELDALSDRVRDRLRHLGVQRGDRVGVYLPKSIDALAVILGVMKAGAAYVPVDAEGPHWRTAFILHDCQVRVAFLEARQLARWAEETEQLGAPT